MSLGPALGWLLVLADGLAAPIVEAPARHSSLLSATSVGTDSAKRNLPDETSEALLDVTTLEYRGTEAYMSDVRGKRMKLGIDAQLQRFASAQLRAAKPSRGAVVVLRVKDGQLLTVADYPAHTPKAESVLWSALTPSASLFKLVTTAALIERARLSPEHRVCSSGGEHRIDLEQLKAPRGANMRCQPFSSILANSRNAAYARLVASHLTSEDISNFADRFGFNERQAKATYIELGRYEPSFGKLAVARTATGFKGSSLSTIGAAFLGLVVASGGKHMTLRLLGRDTPTPGELETPNGDQLPYEQVLLPETARRLREMMESVVRHGTAYPAFYDEGGRPVLPGLSVAGKTGTLGHDEETSSWFVGFAPSRSPEIVVAVLLDNGPVWRTTAKSVGASVLKAYFFDSDADHPVHSVASASRSSRKSAPTVSAPPRQ